MLGCSYFPRVWPGLPQDVHSLCSQHDSHSPDLALLEVCFLRSSDADPPPHLVPESVGPSVPNYASSVEVPTHGGLAEMPESSVDGAAACVAPSPCAWLLGAKRIDNIKNK